MMITAIANQKGGVAKTTSTLALGGLLAQKSSCLLVDLDPQGNLTTGLGVTLSDRQPTVYEVMTRKAKIAEAIVETRSGLQLLPAETSLANIEKELLSRKDRFFYLRDVLEAVRSQFDYVLIDCPPSMGLLTANALCAAQNLLIPVQCQFFAVKGLEGQLRTIATIQSQLNPGLKVLGVLPTMAEPNTLMTQEVLKILKNQLNGIEIFTPVPKSVKFPESNLAGEPIHRYAGEWKLVQPYRDVVKAMLLMQDE